MVGADGVTVKLRVAVVVVNVIDWLKGEPPAPDWVATILNVYVAEVRLLALV